MAEEVKKDLPRWFYTARNAQGQLISSSVTAESEIDAARKIQANGLAPLAISQRASGTSQGLNLDLKFERKKKVKAKDLALLCRQFGTMLDSGMPLVRALNALGLQTDHKAFQKALPKVKGSIEGGMSLAQAIGKHKDVFPDLMVGLVAAGEVSGDLPGALDQLAITYEKEAKIRSKIVSAMTYPVVVLVLAFVLVTAMLIFVVPTFAQVFQDLGAELPLATRLLIGISDVAKIAIPVMVVGMFFLSYWYRRNKLQPNVRMFMNKLRIKTPILGPFFKKVAVARFARTMAGLIDAGVPIMQCLQIVGRTSGSIILEEALAAAANDVRGGQTIAVSISRHDEVFPPLTIQMVATGEETGALPLMFQKIADYYEREVESGSEALGALIEPVLLIFLAVIVGGMVLALYLPIFSIFETIAAS